MNAMAKGENTSKILMRKRKALSGMIKMQNIRSDMQEEQQRNAQQFAQIIPSILSFNYPGAIFYQK